jgi:hypothetical protein
LGAGKQKIREEFRSKKRGIPGAGRPVVTNGQKKEGGSKR